MPLHPAYIDDLRRREERQRDNDRRPFLELPLYREETRRSPDKDPEESGRGVVVINIFGDDEVS